MIAKRPAAERGHFNFGWLDTYHTFSFGDYNDPAHMAFRSLRVMNEDVIQPNHGFPMHPHRDMEIVTYVLSGELEHADSMGNRGTIRAGEVQRISAGRGIRHSEANPSATEAVHLYQIWLLPNTRNREPGYEQRNLAAGGSHILIASPDGRDGSATIGRDVSISAVKLKAGEGYSLKLLPNRHAWIQVIRGELKRDDMPLAAGDGLAISDEPEVRLTAESASEILVFDLD